MLACAARGTRARVAICEMMRALSVRGSPGRTFHSHSRHKLFLNGRMHDMPATGSGSASRARVKYFSESPSAGDGVSNPTTAAVAAATAEAVSEAPNLETTSPAVTAEASSRPSSGNWSGLLEELVVDDPTISREELRRLVATDWEHRISLADAKKEFLVDDADLAGLPYFSFENPYTGQKTRFYQIRDVKRTALKRWRSMLNLELAQDLRTLQNQRKKGLARRRGTGKVAPQTSDHVVNAALWGNGIVFVAKAGAFLVSGSGAMLSEAVHTLADLGNQYLLKVGVRRSSRTPNYDHPYGHASERYIFGLISGVGIFFLGCGVTVYHGITLLLEPAHAIESLPIAFGVLAFSGLVESYTLFVAWRQVRQAAAEINMPMLKYIKDGPDPIGVAVMMEDGAAVIGVGIAAASLGLTWWTGNIMFDAIGTMAIGGLLGGVAAFLVTKNREMLVGRSVPRESLQAVEQALLNDKIVRTVYGTKGVVMGSDQVRFKAEIQFNGWNLTEKYLAKTGVDLGLAQSRLQSKEDLDTFLCLFGDDLVDMLSDEVDRLEGVVREHMPTAKYVDLEVW